MASVDGEVDLARKVGLVGDARLEGVAQLVSDRLGVVFVEVGTDDVDIGREVVSGMSLRILLVRPMNLEVSTFLIVGSAFGANLVDGEAQGEVAVELVALVVTEGRLETP